MIQANSIDEVITNLDKIIEWSKLNKSRIGYFAVLYRRMTLAVKNGIAKKYFDYAERMECLDVIFANRYLQAWDAYINKQPCSSAWCKVFDACAVNNLVVLQHIILGVNTHINLDLAIAAAETCPGEKIYALRNDFEKINTLIANESQAMQNTLCKIWWPLKLLTNISNHRQDAVINFSIDEARKASWANAVALAFVEGDTHTNYIEMMDSTVVKIAGGIMTPNFFTKFLFKIILWMENKDVSKIIDDLKE